MSEESVRAEAVRFWWNKAIEGVAAARREVNCITNFSGIVRKAIMSRSLNLTLSMYKRKSTAVNDFSRTCGH